MSSGCSNALDHPCKRPNAQYLFLLHTRRYQNIVLRQYWHALSSKRTWVSRQDLRVKRLGWCPHPPLFPLAWSEHNSSTFQKIIYWRISKQPRIMHTSRPFYIDMNSLITVVTHCLDILTKTLCSVYIDLYNMLYSLHSFWRKRFSRYPFLFLRDHLRHLIIL